MKLQHYLGIVVLLVVGYVIGIKYPTLYQNIPGLG